jgi:hypothetical protein
VFWLTTYVLDRWVVRVRPGGGEVSGRPDVRVRGAGCVGGGQLHGHEVGSGCR